MMLTCNATQAKNLCTVHEQDSVVARLERTNCMCAIACLLLVSILQNFSSNLYASVKFTLSCTVSGFQGTSQTHDCHKWQFS